MQNNIISILRETSKDTNIPVDVKKVIQRPQTAQELYVQTKINALEQQWKQKQTELSESWENRKLFENDLNKGGGKGLDKDARKFIEEQIKTHANKEKKLSIEMKKIENEMAKINQSPESKPSTTKKSFMAGAHEQYRLFSHSLDDFKNAEKNESD